MDRKPASLSNLLPVLVLVGLVVVLMAGWWGFPYFQTWVNHNDCVASGRVNC